MTDRLIVNKHFPGEGINLFGSMGGPGPQAIAHLLGLVEPSCGLRVLSKHGQPQLIFDLCC